MALGVLMFAQSLERPGRPSSCASLCQMPGRLRQPRHSRASERPRQLRAVARLALLCALAVLGAGCPAVLDLEPGEAGPAPESPEQLPPELETEAEPSVVDASAVGVNPLSPRVEDDTPCRPLPAPALEDAGRPDLAAAPGQARPAAATSGPELALRAVLAAGYLLPCGGEHAHVVQLPDGYAVSALGQTGLCPPFDTMLYRLRVSKSGQITVLDGVTVNPAQLRCDAGEPQLTQEPTEPPLA
jgi:hypothetical protein